MTIPHVLGFTFLALLFLIAGSLLGGVRSWSPASSATIAWLCSALATALTVVGATSLLCQTEPGRIPRRSSRMIWAAVVVVAGLGIVVDNWGAFETFAFRIGIAEWLGFSVLLYVLFEVPRSVGEQHAT